MYTFCDAFSILQDIRRAGAYSARDNRHLIHRIEYIIAARELLLHCSNNLITDSFYLIGKGKNAAERLFNGMRNTGKRFYLIAEIFKRCRNRLSLHTGFFGKFPNLVGNDGKAFTRLSCMSRLNRRIHSQ